MNSVILTKDADKTLCILYKEYLYRKDNISKFNASQIEESYFDILFPNQNNDDLIEELIELKNNGLITLDIAGNVRLHTNAIIYMENRFKNGLSEVVDFITKFIP